jgi:endonuclease/exonuclease/phosphatase family metal-dependent hydrolase
MSVHQANRILVPALLLWLLLTSALLIGGCARSSSGVMRVAFYNVENLFDIEADPEKADDDWTPEGKQHWTQERYDKKLQDLAKVIRALGPPHLLGLCEVENRRVLEDLANTRALRRQGYEIVHFASPDRRGIDVALMFRRKYFRHLDARPIPAADPDLITRDVLHVSLVDGRGDTLHVFVNHWPSRSGGKSKSAPLRMHMATLVADEVRMLLLPRPDAAVIVMGDFNDTPSDASVVDQLVGRAGLFNPFYALAAGGEGTYNYRGNWDMLDQILISPSMRQDGGRWQYIRAGVFREPWMLFEHPRFGWSPNRTYGGPNYYGGYSDHLPVYMDLKKGDKRTTPNLSDK